MNTTNRTNRNHNAVRAAAFEALESRQMMSVSWSAGALTINGSNGNDSIVVDCQDYLPGISQIRVRENGAVTQNWTLYQNAKGLTVYGNAGNDTIDLSAVKFGAVVFGGANNDTIKGSKAADAIYGNEGDDTLYGNGGADTLDGGAGDDTLVGGGGADALWGGPGIDTASYAERTKPVYVAIDGLAYDGEVGEYDNVHTDVENLTGGLGNDILTGSSADNRIEGNGGSDILHGGAGKDVLFGGMVLNNAAKNNTGVDTMYGDAGDDQLWAPSNGCGLMHGGANNDVLFGSKNSDDLYGDGGDDSMFGGGGNDNLYGGVGKNYFYGGEGADVIVAIGGSDAESIHGEGGTDTFWTDNGEDTIDYTDAELKAGRLHRVDHFEAFHVFNGVTIQDVKVSSDPLGQDLPDPAVPAGTDWANFSDSPLFAPNGPSPDEIHQSTTLGDCWYVSSLSAVARKNPAHLRNGVVSMGDGTFAVEFVKGNERKYVRVDAELPVDGSGDLVYVQKGAGGSIWPAIYEKAEAFLHADVASYALIEGDDPMFALKELGGWDAGETFWYDKEMKMGANTLLKKIDDLMKDGNVVEYASLKDSPLTDGIVVANHAYSVVSVNKDGNGKLVSLTLRNPWGTDGVHPTGNPNDGLITLTANEAWLGLNAICFAKF